MEDLAIAVVIEGISEGAAVGSASNVDGSTPNADGNYYGCAPQPVILVTSTMPIASCWQRFTCTSEV